MNQTGIVKRQDVSWREQFEHHFPLPAMLELHEDAVWAMDTEGTIIEVNTKAVSLTGYTRDTLNGMSVRQILTSDKYSIHDVVQKTCAGEVQTAEFTLLTRVGMPLLVQTIFKPLLVQDVCMGVFCIAEDMTGRVTEQKRLQEIERMYNLISENAQDIISYSTPDGICRYVSPAIRKALGYEPEEIIGTLSTSYYHPDDVQELLQKQLADEDVFTLRVWHKQKSEYRWFETTAKKIYDENGTYRKILGIGRDVTERIKTEKELRATKDQLEAFIEGHSDAIAIFDQDGNVTRINPVFEQMFGWTSEEMIGRNLLNFPSIPESMQGQVHKLYDEARSGTLLSGVETMRVTKDGRMLNVLLSTSPIRDTNGNFAGWSALLKDITEKKQAEELLLQSEKLSIAGQLAAGIAHEIRNPLTALKGFTQLMKAGVSRTDEYLRIMESELNRIELILSELLVLAKPQAQKFELKDIAGIIQEVITLIESQAILYGVEVLAEIEPDLPQIPCDGNQLKQVFINFLKNAIESMPHGGVIKVALKKHGEHDLLVRIIDQGCGMPEDRVKKIGEPFYTTKEKGTGLGLMVSKKIIEVHRGRMCVQSQLGVGTTVEVYLPHTNSEEDHSKLP